MPTCRDTPIIVFDVNETLLDISTLEPLFERLMGDRAIMREWFAQLIVYSQTMTLSGRYTPFGELAAGVLHMVASNHGVVIADSDVDELKGLIGSMPAHADAAEGLGRLRDAGFRLVTLTNSASGESPTPLERAGLAGYFERSFSVEAVKRFKPAPETYHHVASEMGVEPSHLCMVACHLWDTIGAQSAGCSAAFLARPHNALLPGANLPVPDFYASGIPDLAAQIIQKYRHLD